MALENHDIADLILASLDAYDREKITDINPDALSTYLVWPKLMNEKRVKQEAGPEFRFQCMTDYSNSLDWQGLYATQEYNQADYLVEGVVPIRYGHASAIYDFRELQVNAANAGRIQNLLETRIAALEAGVTEGIENVFWSKPADSTDKETPYGIQMFVVKNSSKGFYGGDPTGFSSGYAGLATATYTGWKNYTDTYTNVTQADFLDAVWEMALETDFIAPQTTLKENIHAGDVGYYTTTSVYLKLKALVENRNESLGKDLDWAGDTFVIGGKPVYRVPKLDKMVTAGTESSGVFYQLDWRTINTYTLAEFLQKDAPRKLDKQPSVYAVDWWLNMNIACKNRRKNGVMYAV